MRLDPKGQFYLRQAFYEDVQGRNPEPMKCLDFTLPIKGIAEAIAVGIAFAKAMGYDLEKTQLAFGFRWTELKERNLVSLVEPTRHIWPRGPAYQDEVFVFVEVPLETPLFALGAHVNKAVKPLFEVFNGFELGDDVVEDLTRKTIERRL